MEINRMAKIEVRRSTKVKLTVLAVIGLILTYAFGTRAIDTGSYWQYLGCAVFLVLSIRLLQRAFRK